MFSYIRCYVEFLRNPSGAGQLLNFVNAWIYLFR